MNRVNSSFIPFLLWAGATAHAQLSCDQAITETTADVTAANRDQQLIKQAFTPNRLTACAAAQVATVTPGAQAAADSTVKTIGSKMAVKRTDVQPGAAAGAAGSTTAVASASKPSLFGLALENGAITQTSQATSATVSVNPWKVVESLVHDENGTISPSDPGSVLLRKLALSLTLNTNSSQNAKQTNASAGAAATPITLLTQAKQISNLTVHFDIHNDRDPMSGGAAKKIRAKVYPAFGRQFFDSVRPIVQFEAETLNAEVALLAGKSGADIQTEVSAFLKDQGMKLASDPLTAAAIPRYRSAASDILMADKSAYDAIAHSPTLSLEYSLDRQPLTQAAAGTASTMPLVNTPDLHTVRLIHANQFIGASDYTITASASFFGQKTAGMPDVWRDFQVGAKLTIPFAGIKNAVDKGSFELSGLFEDLRQMPLGINLQINGVSITQPGKIGLFQAKYSIPIGNNSGVQVPVSVTYSNRTDLIKESDVQGNIGITFDLDKLVAGKQTAGQ
jgi:hypothetical protein